MTRVPEIVLLALAFFGGSLGAYLAMYKRQPRHKTKTQPFNATYWTIAYFHLIVVVVLLGVVLSEFELL